MMYVKMSYSDNSNNAFRMKLTVNWASSISESRLYSAILPTCSCWRWMKASAAMAAERASASPELNVNVLPRRNGHMLNATGDSGLGDDGKDDSGEWTCSADVRDTDSGTALSSTVPRRFSNVLALQATSSSSTPSTTLHRLRAEDISGCVSELNNAGLWGGVSVSIMFSRSPADTVLVSIDSQQYILPITSPAIWQTSWQQI